MRGDSGGALVQTVEEDRGWGGNLYRCLARAGGFDSAEGPSDRHDVTVVDFPRRLLLLVDFLAIPPFGGTLTAASQAGTFLLVATKFPSLRCSFVPLPAGSSNTSACSIYDVRTVW